MAVPNVEAGVCGVGGFRGNKVLSSSAGGRNVTVPHAVRWSNGGKVNPKWHFGSHGIRGGPERELAPLGGASMGDGLGGCGGRPHLGGTAGCSAAGVKGLNHCMWLVSSWSLTWIVKNQGVH